MFEVEIKEEYMICISDHCTRVWRLDIIDIIDGFVLEFDPGLNTWILRLNGENFTLGKYTTLEEVNIIRDKLLDCLFGEDED